MAIKTSDLNAKLFGKANKRVVATPQEAQTAVKDKAQQIELAVAGEQRVAFELLAIPASEIESKTRVFAQNAREQSFLNEHALSDILSTLKLRGQQYPAVGRRCPDGKIEVLDGSRRRMSCLFAQQEFLIYVADNIETKHAKFLSDVANAHKPLSLYEKGREMQLLLDSGEAGDQKSLAHIYNCSEALVSGALKAAALPLQLLQTYPNISDVGRPTIVKLHKQYFNLDEDSQNQLLDKCTQAQKDIMQSTKEQGVARLTKQVSDMLELWIKELQPQTIKQEPKAKIVTDRIRYQRKGNQVALNLKKVDQAQLDAILNFIEKTLN